MRKTRYVLFIFLLLAYSLFAQEATTAIDLARSELDITLAKLADPLGAWNARYLSELKKLETKVQSAGDLDQMLAVRKEMQHMQTGEQAIASQHPDLKRLRAVYDTRAKKILASAQVKKQQALAAYTGKLKSLQASYTKAGKIDQALIVREELSTLAAALLRSPTRPIKVKGNRTPGSLVIGGSYYSGESAVIPTHMQNRKYVRVFAGRSTWYGLTPDGKLDQEDKTGRFKMPETTKPFVSLSCGSLAHFGFHADGTYTVLGDEGMRDASYAKAKKLVSVGTGYAAAIAVLADGTAFAMSSQPKEDVIPFKPPVGLFENIKFAAANEHFIYLVKQDNSAIEVVYKKGVIKPDVPEELHGKQIVDLQLGPTGIGALALTSEGEVIRWNAPRPPDDLPKAKQIRTNYRLSAAQMMDGSWRAWSKTDWAQDLVKQIEALGPLKDLALGDKFFIAIK